MSKLSDSVDSHRRDIYNISMNYTKINIKRIFKEFGLNDRETVIYLEALKHEELTPFTLAKLTNIPRTTVYDTIMSLSLKGLVELDQSEGFEKQQTLIRAKNPSLLRTMLQKKRDDLVSLEYDFLNILPLLKKDFHQQKANADFQFYPGIEGAKYVYSLKNDLDLTMLSFDYLFESDIFGRKQMDEIVDKSLKVGPKKNSEKRIVPLTRWTKEVLAYQVGRNKKYLNDREIRYIEDSSFIINQRIEIIGNWIHITSAKDKEIWGITINSPLLVGTLTSIFNIIWRKATPLTLEMVTGWGEHPINTVRRKRGV